MPRTPTPSDLRPLRDRIDGELLLASDAGHADARLVWNARFQPRPAAVVRCRDRNDVAVAVEFAREQGVRLSVRGGGHSYAGLAVDEGALVLDLSGTRTVRVDPDRRVARVGPGARWADVDAATQEHGLATTGATVSSVGVAGFVLGGGSGWLARRHGLGVDNLTAAEIVTADSGIRRTGPEENADLFWAVRGGGGNFGVVTEFELRLHPIGPEIVSAQAFHPIERAGDALRFYREFARAAEDDVTVYAFALRVPPVEPFPQAQRGRPSIALMAAHSGDVAAGEAALGEMAEFGAPMVAGVQRSSYVATQQAFDAGMPNGLRWYSRAHYLDALDDAAIDTFVRHVEALPGPFSMAYFEPMGGAIGRVASDAMAFPHRSAAFGLHILPGWSDPGDDEPLMRWAREFHDAMSPHATGGVYVNLLGRDESARIPDAYGSNYERLKRLKAEYDPENLFRLNQNIEPAD